MISRVIASAWDSLLRTVPLKQKEYGILKKSESDPHVPQIREGFGEEGSVEKKGRDIQPRSHCKGHLNHRLTHALKGTRLERQHQNKTSTCPYPLNPKPFKARLLFQYK